MSDKPLHVQVAEALGCEVEHDNCMCDPAFKGHDDNGVGILRYDEDWAATGPLVEKYQLSVNSIHGEKWWATWDGPRIKCDTCGHEERNEISTIWDDEYYSTPLLAICHLLIALGKAGKLDPR